VKKFLAIVIIASFLAVVILVTTIDLIRGGNAPAPSSPAPAAAEVEPRVAALILQLGDDDAKKRNAAFDELRKIGEAALPQLQKSLTAVHPNVAATIRTLISLISGKPPEAMAQQPPPAPAPDGWAALPELPKPAIAPAPQAQPPQPRKETEAEWRARFEELMSRPTPQARNLREMVKLVREGNLAALDYAEKMWGWDGNDIRRYLQLEQIDRPKLVPTQTAGLSLDLSGTFGAVMSAGGDGVRVTQVKAGTPAATAGLLAGDVVTQINGKQIGSLDDARASFANAEKGKPLKIEVQRRGDALTLSAPNP
jgi:membrane-associated protease RseP (regulator of RpoE activity)